MVSAGPLQHSPHYLPQASNFPEGCGVGRPRLSATQVVSGGTHILVWPMLTLWTEASRDGGASQPAGALS